MGFFLREGIVYSFIYCVDFGSHWLHQISVFQGLVGENHSENNQYFIWLFNFFDSSVWGNIDECYSF